MANSVQALAWDSEFFSKKIAIVLDVKELTPEDIDGFDIVKVKVSCDNYDELTKLAALSFTVAEGELVFKKKVPPSVLNHHALDIVEAQLEDVRQLVELASQSYNLTRFRQPWFTHEQSMSFYGEWIKKSVLGEFDDVCLIKQTNNVIEGFISLKKVAGHIQIGLIAVLASEQGKGTGKQLLKMAEIYALQNGSSEIFVTTQVSNIAAASLYIGSGYSLTKSNYWLYKSF